MVRGCLVEGAIHTFWTSKIKKLYFATIRASTTSCPSDGVLGITSEFNQWCPPPGRGRASYTTKRVDNSQCLTWGRCPPGVLVLICWGARERLPTALALESVRVQAYKFGWRMR